VASDAFQKQLMPQDSAASSTHTAQAR
jgi:hypothetical protein